jgi:hypothetical protein
VPSFQREFRQAAFQRPSERLRNWLVGSASG